VRDGNGRPEAIADAVPSDAAPSAEDRAPVVTTRGRRIALVTIVGSVVFAIGAIGFALTSSSSRWRAAARVEPSTTTTQARAAAMSPQAWALQGTAIAPAGGGFRVVFPDPPFSSSYTASGMTFTYYSDVGDDLSVTFVDMPPPVPSLQFLAQATTIGRVISSRPITFQHRNAVEIVSVDANQQYHDSVEFSQGARIYTVEGTGPSNPPTFFPNFLGSFRLTNSR
jgi:hypothetical protein